jgi:hypothetical protein
MRRLILLLVVATTLACGTLAQPSGASFTSASSSNVRVTTDTVTNWLHLYSQSTDPDGLTAYCTQAPGTNPAATGADFTLAVNLGLRSKASATTCNRVLTVKTPSAFPTGTTITVTAVLLADPGTGTQPITSVGFSAVGAGGTFTNPLSLGLGQKRQLNLKVRPAAAGVTYRPTILITVTYTGVTATYYRYSVPVTVTGQ